MMKKLADIDTKQLEFMGKNMQESSPMIGEFNQQRGLLAGQAAFLLRQIKPSKVASVEYNQLALVYVRLGNIPQARTNFEHSVKRARNDDSLTRADAVRAFASFQFAQHEPEAGRKNFDEAIRLVGGKHDYELSATVNILQAWAVSEAFIGDMVRAQDRLEQARQVYQLIQNPAVRFPLITTLPSPGTPPDQIGPGAPQVPPAGTVVPPVPPIG